MILGGSRISQQLCEYNPRQLGILSFYNCLYYRKVPSCCSSLSPLYLRLPSFIRASSFSYTLSPKRNFRLSTKCSSSSITSNNEDLGGVFIGSNYCVQNTTRLSDYLSSAEGGPDSPPERLSPVAGGIVALGKFDALHIGHRELAIQAAKTGVPFLLSFIGMAEILGWEPRPPVVAICDRKRILSSWAPLCSNLMPKEFQVEFSKVRNLTPKEFVEKLSNELGVCGVVAGENYRFGYKAAGDASDLLRLCEEYGMRACIINSVMDKTQESRVIGSNNSKEQGQVSSTRVRQALADGDMKYVSQLLGRNHRLILEVKSSQMICRDKKKTLSSPRSSLLNLPPKEGFYENCSLFIDDEDEVPCRVIIDKKDVHLEWDQISPHKNIDLFGIDFNESIH